jgi:cell division transport system ATP-binding protein
MIEFNNVSKIYGNGTVALKDVNIRIEPGEFVFVVGASGAGKSTFLKLMIREEVPTQGTIQIKRFMLNDLKRSEIPYFRRSLGVVFQDFRLIPNMNVYDNVAFAMRVIGAREKKIRKRVPYVISLVGLSSKARSMPNELSGGEQQRVSLARALANNADIVIADEPTGNVDPQMSFEIVSLLMRLNEAGTTVIMVTHEHDLVRRFDRRVIILENGRVVYDGAPLKGKAAGPSQGHLDEMPTDITRRYTPNNRDTHFTDIPANPGEGKTKGGEGK